MLLTGCDRPEEWPTVEKETPTQSSASTYWGESPNGHTWHQATTAQKKWICDQMANKGTQDSQFWMDFFNSFYIRCIVINGAVIIIIQHFFCFRTRCFSACSHNRFSLFFQLFDFVTAFHAQVLRRVFLFTRKTLKVRE